METKHKSQGIRGTLSVSGSGVPRIIAEKGSKLIEVSTLHYDCEIARLQAQHAQAETVMQERYETLSITEQSGSSDDVAELEIELIQKEEKDKLKVYVEMMVAAVTRRRASLADASTATTYVVEIPQENNTQASPLRKLMRRIRSLFSRKQELKEAAEEEELQADTTISLESNPCFTPDSQHDFAEKKLSSEMPRSCPSSLGGPTPSPARFGV